MMRKPSCLISCSHRLLDGSLSVLVGRHGAMNPADKVRCNMRKQIEFGRDESSRCCFARTVLDGQGGCGMASPGKAGCARERGRMRAIRKPAGAVSPTNLGIVAPDVAQLTYGPPICSHKSPSLLG